MEVGQIICELNINYMLHAYPKKLSLCGGQSLPGQQLLKAHLKTFQLDKQLQVLVNGVPSCGLRWGILAPYLY